jgi:hypothetical protein
MAALSAMLAKLGSLLSLDASNRLLLPATPPQFDNSKLAATTAFVRQFGMQAGAFIQPPGTTYQIDSTAFGATLNNVSTAAATWTMPPVTSAVAGARIEIVNFSAYPLTINRSNSDTIIRGGVVLTTVTIPAGDVAVFEYNGGTVWMMVGGSAALVGSGLFTGALAASGYQKLPSGILIQWGNLSVTDSNATRALTFPITFPNACQSLQLTSWTSSGSEYQHTGRSQTGATVQKVTTASTIFAYDWIAIGY